MRTLKPAVLVFPILAFWGAFSNPAFSDVTVDVKPLNEINQISGNSNPDNFVEFQGDRYFTATTWTEGTQLWVSKGGADDTQQIDLGQSYSQPRNLTVVNTAAGERLFFTAQHIDSGPTLWVSDGTDAGTKAIKNIQAYDLTPMGSKVYFKGYTEQLGRELWVSDGTEAGTVLVKDINPGTDSSALHSLTVSGSALYFRADDSVHGPELWRSDGTSAGTDLVKDLDPADDYYHAHYLAGDGNGNLFFSATEGSGLFLYHTDGTEAGTVPMNTEADYPRNLTYWESKNALVYRARQHGAELWSSKGTPGTTEEIKDINPVGSSTPENFVVYDRWIYFTAETDGHGRELWRTNLRESDTTRVADIHPDADGSNPLHLTVFNDRLWFTAVDGTHGRELWVHDAADDSTRLYRDIKPGPFSAFTESTSLDVGASGDWLMFGADDGSHGREPWFSNGTESGTGLLKDIYTGSAGSGIDGVAEVISDQLVFVASDGEAGAELWHLKNGQPALIKDINPGEASSRIFDLTKFGDHLYFKASDGEGDEELWRTNGHEADTVRVKDINPDRSGSPGDLVTLNDALLFAAYDASAGMELWRSDGTSAGTQLLADINSGRDSSGPEYLTRVGDRVLFQANYNELWRSDGSGAGTVKIATIGSKPNIRDLTPLSETTAVFTADNGTAGKEVWMTDLTETGTRLLKDINPGSESSDPSHFFSLSDGRILFSANDGANGQELWITDGTESGTFMVENMDAGSSNSSPLNLIRFKEDIYFSAESPQGERELYRLSPDTLETTAVTDLTPGRQNLTYKQAAVLGDYLIFPAVDTDSKGPQLWLTDGTEESIRIVSDFDSYIYGGPAPLNRINDRLIFTVDTQARGLELWEVTVTTPEPPEEGSTPAPPSSSSSSGGSLGLFTGLIGLVLLRSRAYHQMQPGTLP